MKRVVVFFALFVVLVVSSALPIFAVKAGASPLLTYDCIVNNCIGHTVWVGNQHGIKTYTTTSNPTVVSPYPDTFFDRYIEVNQSSGNDKIVVGEEAICDLSGCQGTFCSFDGSHTLYYFYRAQLGSDTYNACEPVPTSNINKALHLEISYFVTSPGGMFVQTVNDGGSTAFCDNGCFFDTTETTWANGHMSDTMFEDSVSIHIVWGVAWNQSGFLSVVSGGWKWQGNEGTTTQSGATGWYWKTPPSSFNQGGTLYSCTYNNYNGVCNQGS